MKHPRRGGIALVLASASLFVASFAFPYWDMRLKAPQYPEGLNVSVYLNHVEGDVHEIDLLNHYIGMSKLESAAPLEKRFAWFGILGLAAATLLVIPAGGRIYKLFYLVPPLFLGGFLGDLYFWMYRFGHVLNPEAPVHVQAFTPALLGEGKIGQFTTLAFFGTGFWMAFGASVLLLIVLARLKPLELLCQPGRDAVGSRQDGK